MTRRIQGDLFPTWTPLVIVCAVHSNPARELALLGAAKRRETVHNVARSMRADMGLVPLPALARQA